MGSGPTRLEAAVTERIRIFLYSGDPILQSGLAVQLRQRPEVVLVDADDVDSAQVALVITDSVDEETLRVLHALQRGGVPRLVLLASTVDAGDLARVVEAGVCGVLRRREMTVDKLLSVILAAAAGDGSVPPDLLGRLLDQVGRLQRQVLDPRGFILAGLAEREIEVLRLAADGMETREIASRLCYSERTVKNVLHEVITRLQLRNRTHAVAYAVREGLI